MAQQLDHAGVAAGRDDVGVDRVAGCGFEQQEGADDDDQQHEDAADEATAEEGEGAGHGASSHAAGLRLGTPLVLPDISPSGGDWLSCCFANLQR